MLLPALQVIDKDAETTESPNDKPNSGNYGYEITCIINRNSWSETHDSH